MKGEIQMKIDANSPSEPAGYGSWQQVRASDEPDSQGSKDDPETSAVTQTSPATNARRTGTWQQVRATDEKEGKQL